MNKPPTIDQEASFSRRKTLAMGAGLIASMLIPERVALAADFWSQPRSLWLQRRTNAGLEEFRGVYFHNGRLIWDEYVKICKIMRDVTGKEVVQMSPVLLDILCGVQGVSIASGDPERPLMTTSAYRNGKTNSNTEGAAKKSQHMRGCAWDGYLVGGSPKSVADSAKYLQGGGVGVYVDRGFCHLDSGKIRTWRGA